ncbi:MAG TPA: hypothetical protein VN607_11755 [Gemmatimonadaceae bacterium]|jgi:hypothetical protein|nr:hypothetical protein [Gemmatimonadaceae bacterium]
MKRGPLVIGVLVVGLAGLLLWNTLGAQRVTCNACVEFGGQRNCAAASAASQAEATKSAVSTACGVLARGMDQSIACDNTKPVSLECKTPS